MNQVLSEKIPLKENKKILTVTQLTKDIKLLLDSVFGEVWVEGEVSGFKEASSGHLYFDLKDSSSIIHAVMFRGNNSAVKFKLKDGLQVICFGRVSVYEPRGQYQFYVEKIEPKGLGALQLAFEQLKEKLTKEGLFEARFKKPLPYLPGAIGIVTSPTGAAIHDILQILERRFNNIEVIINPVRVQGDAAAEEIARAINDFNELKNVDVIIVGRGGGSLDDLWAFNEEVVARAIFASKIPIISAVGHEVDYVISDFVSDLRAKTPSEAAELVLPRKEDLKARIFDLNRALIEELKEKIFQCQQAVDELEGRLKLLSPKNVVLHSGEKNKALLNRLNLQLNQIMRNKDNELRHNIEHLNALSPLKVLARGYSITFKSPEGLVLKNISDIEIGEEIETRLNDGVLLSKVRQIWQGK